MRACTNCVLATTSPLSAVLSAPTPRFAAFAFGDGADEVYGAFTTDGYTVVGGMRARQPRAALGRDPMPNRVPHVPRTISDCTDSDVADADSDPQWRAHLDAVDGDEREYAAADAETYTALRDAFARVFPARAAAQPPLERAWIGVMCKTRDGQPVLGRVPADADSTAPRVWCVLCVQLLLVLMPHY